MNQKFKSRTYSSGAQISQKCRSYFKILGARRMAWSKLHSEDPKILVATTTWILGFVRHWLTVGGFSSPGLWHRKDLQKVASVVTEPAVCIFRFTEVSAYLRTAFSLCAVLHKINSAVSENIRPGILSPASTCYSWDLTYSYRIGSNRTI